ncbi:MAG: NAD-dependent epimerase/dehydratase family protein [Chloroherpetonaceae bacterium]|nr:NAD-dependent epimerase/dehydratase family protein [Chloroherpetonaceae bacterium]MDW8437367.1 NAD-dependent epimerase/dehydratase family protein [Chloroherpetonaceae bacterium]
MSKETVLITGATGYLGSALAHHLHRRYGDSIKLKALVRASSSRRFLANLPIDFVLGDVRNPASLWDATEGADVVFHCAALVSFRQKDYRNLYRANVVGTRNLVNACLKNRVKRLVHISSTAAIGASGLGEWSDEQTPFQAWQQRIGYFASKRLSEFEIWRGVAEGLDAVIVNPSVALGDWNGWLCGSSEFIADLFRGKIPFAPKGSTGFVDLRDVVDAIERAWKFGETGERYIVSSESLSYQSLVERVARFRGARCRNVLELPSSVGVLLGAASDALAYLFNFSSPIALDSVRISALSLRYSNQKSIARLGASYRPLDETIERILIRRNLLR